MSRDSSSRDGARPRAVRFVDVSTRDREPASLAWLSAREDAFVDAPDYPVSALNPPEVPSHARPALAPLIESVRPPAAARPPSQLPPPHPRAHSMPPAAHAAPPRSPSQFPGAAGGSQYPVANDAQVEAALRRRDTFVEELVPRAEEEAAAAIKSALTAFASERGHALAQAERELLQLVKVICRRVVLREVTLSSGVVEALVREGLLALGNSDRVLVRLGPFFADAVDHISDNLRQSGVDCTVAIDRGAGTYGCVIETELGRVDESVETRLDVLLSSLDSVP